MGQSIAGVDPEPPNEPSTYEQHLFFASEPEWECKVPEAFYGGFQGRPDHCQNRVLMSFDRSLDQIYGFSSFDTRRIETYAWGTAAEKGSFGSTITTVQEAMQWVLSITHKPATSGGSTGADSGYSYQSGDMQWDVEVNAGYDTFAGMLAHFDASNGGDPNPPFRRPPCPPNIEDLIAGRGAMPADWFKPIINQVLLQASKDFKDRVDAGRYKEVGGWILISPDGQEYKAFVKPSEQEPKLEFDFGSRKYFRTPGDSSLGVVLEFPRSVPEVAKLLDEGWLVVGDFHSHANKMASPGDDQSIAARRKNPGVWIYPDGTTQVYGPASGILNVGVPKRCR